MHHQDAQSNDKSLVRSSATTARQQRGSVLTEFIMVAPVMLLIAGSALRFYQELQAQEVGITFVREVATLTYSQCLDRTVTKIERVGNTDQDQLVGDETKTLAAISDCLKDEIIPNFMRGWDSASPIAYKGDFAITVEAYRCDITEISSNQCAKIGKVSCSSSAGCDKPNTDASQVKLHESARNRLVTARITFTIAPLSSFIPSITPRTVTYDATV